MKNGIIGLLAIVLFFGCAKDEILPTDSIKNPETLSVDEINKTLYEAIEAEGVYNWNSANDQLLWSAAMQADSVFAIGYQPTGTQDLKSTIHQIDIESSTWIDTRDQILNIILAGEQLNNPDLTIENLLPFGYPETLPSMAVQITNFETIKEIRAMSEIRYLEPMGYELAPIYGNDNVASERSGSGCGVDPDWNLNNADYSTISPFVKQPWNHASSNIASAWNKTTGDGVTITVIDTGVSDDQENLGSSFNSGASSGRSVERYSTKYSGMWWWKSLDAPHDQCGHGTQMAGLATAPRGSDGNAVGVAYNSDLISIRAVEDVIISSSSEKEGVKNAMIIAGNRNDVKVISMSLGTPFWSGTVADGVYFAYNKGKFMSVAAGTSLSWTSWYGVIFPATMSQTVAVTGVRDNYNSGMQRCNTCHDGSKVDFVMVMQRASNTDRTSLTLALDTNQPTYVGGSSCATASVAGIAALVFSNNPGITRQQVYNALKENASFYPNKSNNFGWGIIDANAAVD